AQLGAVDGEHSRYLELSNDVEMMERGDGLHFIRRALHDDAHAFGRVPRLVREQIVGQARAVDAARSSDHGAGNEKGRERESNPMAHVHGQTPTTLNGQEDTRDSKRVASSAAPCTE